MDLQSTIDNINKKSDLNNSKRDGDYYDEKGLLMCGKCHTRKQVEITLFDKVRRPYCLCKCEKEKRDAVEAAFKRAEKERKIAEMKITAFPKEERGKMEKYTFANDDMSNERITQAMQNYVDNFAELKKQGKGLLLYGTCGTGKTYAACEIANALIEKGYTVKVTNFSRVLNDLQGTFEKQEYIDGFSRYNLLVIDDLGIERNTEYAKEQVYNIIDSRYRAGLPMIITTNLTIDKIKNPEDMENIRIYDRILERCFPIEVTGSNRRRRSVRESYTDMKELLGLE
jgi:DNA replication protein DnaC